jgi:hypothetical protein
MQMALRWYETQATSHDTKRKKVLRDLSMALCQLGGLGAAVKSARRCLAEGTEMFGPEHHDTYANT